jgi:Family of unknown function (DUF5706)
VFHRRQESSAQVPDTRVVAESGVSFAWKTHSAITDWTAKVDYKAAIVLSLGGIVLGFFVTLSGHGRVLAGLHGWPLIVERIGLGISTIGVLLAGLVVAPRLGRRQAERSWKQNIVYFGHLRHWSPVDLSRELKSLDTDQQLGILATQLVETSKIAWRKHNLLQFSMLFLLLGIALVALSASFETVIGL